MSRGTYSTVYILFVSYLYSTTFNNQQQHHHHHHHLTVTMNEEDELYGMEGTGRFDTDEFDQEYVDGGIRDDVRISDACMHACVCVSTSVT